MVMASLFGIVKINIKDNLLKIKEMV